MFDLLYKFETYWVKSFKAHYIVVANGTFRRPGRYRQYTMERNKIEMKLYKML